MHPRKSLLPLAAAVCALAASAAPASAAVVFDGSPGTAAPPSTLGPFTMTGFPADGRPEFSSVTDVTGPTGTVGFSPALDHRVVPSSWNTWSHGYTSDVYFNTTSGPTVLSLPAGTDAFYLYAEPDAFDTFDVTATSQDGTTSGTIPVTGDSGAKYFGFYGTGGDKVATITISSTDSSGFAVGEFGIATGGGQAQTAYRCGGLVPTIYPGSGYPGSATAANPNANSTVVGTPGNDVIVTGNGDDHVNGAGGDDVICTNNGDDVVNGDDGNDSIFASDGNDTVGGGAGNDSLDGGTGDDIVRGAQGDDRVRGNDGNDRVEGNVGNDNLLGGRGNDQLVGGTGTDQCNGGPDFDRAKECETSFQVEGTL
jgi:Ca2+-binding RTX toxin-like protein